nr:hypothetical protein [Tanacetum cinerariifolium]
MNDTSLMEKADSNTTPNSSDMYTNEFKDDQNDDNEDDNEDEHVMLGNLIANLNLILMRTKRFKSNLRNVDTTLTQELKECKSILAETSRTLGESNSAWDSCLIALQNKQTELETYKTLNDHTVDYDKLELTMEILSKPPSNKLCVRDFKKFFKRMRRFVRQPRNDKRSFKETKMTRTVKVKGSVLHAETQIILLKNVPNHRETRTNKHSLEVLGAIVKRKIMKRLRMKHVSLLKHQMRLWFRWISFDYRVSVGFGSITGGLDHVNPVIRLPMKHGISRELHEILEHFHTGPTEGHYEADITGIRNVPPNGVFGNEVYGSDSEGFGMNPSSNEFRLCNSDEWRNISIWSPLLRGYLSNYEAIKNKMIELREAQERRDTPLTVDQMMSQFMDVVRDPPEDDAAPGDNFALEDDVDLEDE